ncbi:LysR family transcriptional regulator [Actinopolyspora erythraea]|uniref:LysR family transcriptional regulator n=1 Tax=Actinopolyspora erythraea TaxID=414996 RepID=A0A099DB59_9ACTN|nr:LysR family transcriptional regulator [Actinopolyspora erythraea]ASU77187.1 LysR family transcriptional regulator [Actinopolyspora erythraea]KGI83121.1 LysR family transcriptional regulator [Actinopolyspora erythraea]
MVDPRYVGVFHEVVRTGSYTAAARNLGYSQPAVSQQMRALERALETPLFLRAGGGLELTEAGRILAGHADSVVEDLAAAENKIAAVRELRRGSIRLCAFPSASATLVPSAVARVTEHHPELRIRLSEAEPPDSLEALRRGECDVALAFSYPGTEESSATDITGTDVLDDPMVAVLPVAHPLADRDSVALEELAGQRWIAGCPRCRDHFLRSCEAAGFEPDIAFTTDDNLAVQGLVAAGVGIALMPALVLSFLRHPDVVGRPVDGLPHRRVTAYALWEQHRIPATALMLETFGRIGAEMAVGS